MDKNGYPEDHELETIEKWDLNGGRVSRLFEYVKARWRYASHYWQEKEVIDELTGHPETEIKLSTGGWSGNEDLIMAMERNLILWGLFWYQSRTGGHYWFRVPK